MKFLLFRIGADRYALPLSAVAEVLPRLDLKAIPGALPGVAGVFNHHGAPVPVIDLSALALGEAVRDSLSSRILRVPYGVGPEGEARFLGLLVEAATETADFDESDFKEPGVSVPKSPYLGPVKGDFRGVIQRVEVGALLTPEVREQLWRQAAQA